MPSRSRLEWNYELEDPFDRRHSQAFANAQGQQQGTCIHLGNCDIGCDVRAKNSLDLTYLAAAEKAGCEVRPLHVVRRIEPRDGGYRVEFDRIEQNELVRGEETAARVFVAAGSLGSTELLLRARDEHETLPKPLAGRSAGAGRPMPTSSPWRDIPTRTASGSPSDRRSPPPIDFMDGDADRRAVRHRRRRVPEPVAERGAGLDGRVGRGR